MAFTMMKKKRYKFEVQVCLEELTQVTYLSAVLFAKVRLLDGGNFQEYSTREEVRDHQVRWNSQFSFVCKMYANANTGVLEKADMKVSVRREVKGGRSYQKLGFCVVNLAELAGSGETTRRCLLEGYDRGSRQDNSMLRLTIKMNMISGDPLFKVPERKQEAVEAKPGGDSGSESAAGAPDDDCASSTASSGFGSLTKKKNFEGAHAQPLSSLPSCELPTPDGEDAPALPAPDHPGVTLVGPGTGAGVAGVGGSGVGAPGGGGASCASCLQQQHTHSRNSSNTSGDMSSKASGYGSSVSAASAHSRQSSEGDSAADCARPHHNSVRSVRTTTTTTLTTSITVTGTELCPPSPRTPLARLLLSAAADDVTDSLYLTPDTTLTGPPDVVPRRAPTSPPAAAYRTPDSTLVPDHSFAMPTYFDQKRRAVAATLISAAVEPLANFQVFKQKSLNTIPALIEKHKKTEELFTNFPFLTPLAHRKSSLVADASRLPGCLEDDFYCMPAGARGSADSVDGGAGGGGGVARCTSTPKGDMDAGREGEGQGGVTHRRQCPPERLQRPHTFAAALRHSYTEHARNPSSGSLTASASESGSLDRARAALERRKRAALPPPAAPPPPPPPPPDDAQHVASCRVENTRVNPDSLIEELLAATDLKRAAEDSADTSGLQLFITRDGTAELGSRQRQQLARRDYQRVVVHPHDNR